MSCFYTQDVAQNYFDTQSKQNARRLFTHLIRNNKELENELASLGWNTTCRIITPLQYSVITKYLGEP